MTATKNELLARLNELRAARGKDPLKAWKDSTAKLEAAIAKLAETTLPPAPAAPDANGNATGPTPEPENVEPVFDNDFKLSASLLIYDIPSASDYPNPSGRLRRLGFRANLSCWVIPDGAIPHTLIHEMRTEGNANVDLVRFDMAEGPRLVRMAIDRMKKDVEDQLKRAHEGLANAEERHLLAADADPDARETAAEKYERRAKRIMEHLTELAEDVEAAIKNFGVKPELLGLANARKAFAALQTGYEAKIDAYVAATAALKKAGEAGDANAAALANAAATDAVIPEVMADALREAGDEAAADALQAAFVPESVPAADDGTFSLADAPDAPAA